VVAERAVRRREGVDVTTTSTDTTPIPVMRPWLGREEAEAAAAAVSSGWVAQGPRVAEFERAFAARVAAPYGVAASSCTTALHLALVVAGVAPGDEVVVPSLSFIATANVVRYIGATPVFADVEATTLNLTAATIDAVRTPKTRAVVLVHQVGTPADLDAVHGLCDPAGIVVVEDAACAIGSVYKDRPIGADSDLAAYSFHPRKVITTGEGGMLVTTNEAWAERSRRLREHGMSLSAAARHASSNVVLERYDEVGFNYRMTDVQAAIGLVQLGRLDAIVARRRELAEAYRAHLADLPLAGMIADPPYGLTNYQSCWIELSDDFPVTRDELLQSLLDLGVSARRGIMASHLEPAYADSPHASLPITERLTRRSLILPLFHEMTEDQHDRVVAAVRAAAGST
jgi:dTDP-4-amino-4,6-dideoxygalactose transaminase